MFISEILGEPHKLPPSISLEPLPTSHILLAVGLLRVTHRVRNTTWQDPEFKPCFLLEEQLCLLLFGAEVEVAEQQMAKWAKSAKDPEARSQEEVGPN